MAHILVIEDDEAVRTVLEKFLARFGHVVSSAVNGREGLRMLKQKRADVVITDILMPETDGLEVIFAIKKMESPHIPIIAISGGITTHGVQPLSFLKQAALFGASRVFPKPVDFHGIHTAVQELLAAAGA